MRNKWCNLKNLENNNEIEEKDEELDKIKSENAKEVQKLTETSLRAKSEVSITKKKISEKEQEK